jgi:meckelin
MSVYDEDTAPCKQLEAISQRRVETYRNQEDWAYTLPWLYYRDEADYITNDRGINMDVSFRAKVNSVNFLSFKLAKFTVNGTFVGMEDLTNQFEFCRNFLGKDDQNQWAFGRSYRNSYPCSVNSLLTKDMFLYDFYLADESSESCSHDSLQHDCLYPVPVLNRNLVKDNKFVNVEDDVDDMYTRRFFLFDNQVSSSFSTWAHMWVRLSTYSTNIPTKLSFSSITPVWENFIGH